MLNEDIQNSKDEGNEFQIRRGTWNYSKNCKHSKYTSSCAKTTNNVEDINLTNLRYYMEESKSLLPQKNYGQLVRRIN